MAPLSLRLDGEPNQNTLPWKRYPGHHSLCPAPSGFDTVSQSHVFAFGFDFTAFAYERFLPSTLAQLSRC